MANLATLLKARRRILSNYLKFELNRTVKIELVIIITAFIFFILHNYSQQVAHSIAKHGIARAFSEFGLISLFLIAANLFVFSGALYRALLNSSDSQLSTFLPIKSTTILYFILSITFIKSFALIAIAFLLLGSFALRAGLSFIHLLSLSFFIFSGFIFTSVAGALFVFSSLNIIIERGNKRIKAFSFWFINFPVLILFSLNYSYFKEAFIPAGGGGFKGLIFLAVSGFLLFLTKNLWGDFSENRSEWVMKKKLRRQAKYRVKINVFKLLPPFIRPFVVKDFRLLFRKFRTVPAIVIVAGLIVIAICKHTTNTQTLASSLVIVCLLSFYILSNSYFKMMEQGNEQMSLIKSLPVSAIRYWLAKFIIALIPMLFLSGIAIIGLAAFKGGEIQLILKVSETILLIALVFSFIQTNFLLATFPFTDYMLFLYNMYLILIIITFPIFNLISLVLIAANFFIMKKSLRNFQVLEF